MGDRFYDVMCTIGRPAFWVSSSPVVVGAEHTDRPGGYLLAANHQCPYDIPVLFRHCRRRIDFVSITEVFKHKPVAMFYGAMNAFPLDRSRPDVGTVKTVVDRLRAGRVVGMFPEGGFRRGEASVLRGGAIRSGIGRVALLAGVPVVPAVILGVEAYARFWSWAPVRGVRYGVMFSEPLAAPTDEEAAARLEAELVTRMRAMGADLAARLAAGQGR